MTESTMQFKSILGLGADSKAVADDLVAQADGFDADLALLFASHHHGPEFHALLSTVQQGLNVRNLIGCTGEGIIGPDSEIERQPAVALWLAGLPDVRVVPFLIDQDDLKGLDTDAAWLDRVGVDVASQPSFIVLGEPFSIDMPAALERLDAVYPRCPKVGGMASGAEEKGQNRLFLGEQSIRTGMVGVALSGAVRIDTVVSQGCRPIAKPFVVTRADTNFIEELGGRNAYDVLKEVFQSAASDDQDLMKRGVHLGVVIDEHLNNFQRGDFLVHNVVGVYQDSKLAISSAVRTGQTIQFHVRDAQTADDEMAAMLLDKRQELDSSPTGGLLFSCNGRGRRLFKHDNHDIGLVNSSFGDCAIAGFFAQGEIGPVGGRTFMHGFTSSLILFMRP